MTRSEHRALAVAATGVLLLALSVGLLAASLGGGAGTGADAPSNASEPLQQVHAAGVTGGNVTVGVVDATGFDAAHPALDGRVASARAFGPDATVANGGRNDHGTASAAVVARTAPDADLYLAAFDSPDGYERAVEWLVAADVDVIVAPVSFLGQPGDGSARVSRVATRAVEAGVVFVAPTGNVARGHWTGEYDRVRDGRLRFGSSARNFLHGDGREVSLWLSWDRAHRHQEYSLALYRTDGEATRLVAESSPYADDDVPNQRLRAAVGDGSYFFVVRGPPNATGARLRASSPSHDFQYGSAAGSVVAPATARGALAVGAYDPGGGVEPFSSRGPTRDGRLGVDVVAPDRHDVRGVSGFVGSSAAAPYVGGVAALVLDADPGLSPREVESRIEGSAADAARPGVDFAAGYGLVRPSRAVRDARNATG